MKTSLILSTLLLCGSLFWYMQDKQTIHKPTPLYYQAELPPQQQSVEADLPVHSELSHYEEEPKRDISQTLALSNGGRDATLQVKNLASRSEAPSISWGYHFVPGQKLWYEWKFDQTDKISGEDFVATYQAMMEIESVDANGNITFTLTMEQLSHQWKTKEAEEEFRTRRIIEEKQKLRATITPLGHLIDGEMLESSEKEPFPLSNSHVQFHLNRWIPQLPALEDFDKELRYTFHSDRFDTVHPINLNEYDNSSDHLDTIEKKLFYVFPEDFSIPNKKSVDPEETRTTSEPITSSVSNKNGKAIDHAETEPRRIPSIISREREFHRYQLDRASSSPSSRTIHLTKLIRREEWLDKNNPKDRNQWQETHELKFRKVDGAVVEHHTESISRGKMDTDFVIDLRLLRSEMPESRDFPETPSIE